VRIPPIDKGDALPPPMNAPTLAPAIPAAPWGHELQHVTFLVQFLRFDFDPCPVEIRWAKAVPTRRLEQGDDEMRAHRCWLLKRLSTGAGCAVRRSHYRGWTGRIYWASTVFVLRSSKRLASHLMIMRARRLDVGVNLAVIG
jgi:hypothetical protein